MKLRTCLLLTAGLAAFFSFLRAAAPTGAVALVVVTGDQHSAYDRTAQFVALVDRLKTEYPGLPLAVLLDGDTLENGNVIARRSHGAVDFAEFAALARRAPTVLNLGNHDPEFYDLADTVTRVRATGVQVVSNIVNRSTNQPFAPASVELTLGSVHAVVVGLTTDHLSTYRVAVRPSLDLANSVVWAKANLPRLLGSVAGVADPGKAGATALMPEPASARPATTETVAASVNIVLSHAGLAADREILPLLPDGSLFAGAHDHLRFIQPVGRSVYFHSGAWNAYVSLAWLCRGADGALSWQVVSEPVPADGPADSGLLAVIAKTRAEYQAPEDLALVGRTRGTLTPPDAAKYAVRALRAAAAADAAFVGNTTFGGGLPAGEVNRLAFDACVRFDGTIFTAEVDGVRLQGLLAAANQGPDTPFAERRGEFSFAAGPATIVPDKHYRIATTDWSVKNAKAYFGEPALVWTEKPGLKLKAAVATALAAGRD